MTEPALVRRSFLAACLLATLVVVACARTDVRTQQIRLENQTIARPERVFVHDFASAFHDAPARSAIFALAQQRTPAPAPAEIALHRRLGALIAKHLVTELRERGIPAMRARTGPRPRTGDAVIRGEFVVVDKGNRFQRVLIGFGAGAVELRTLAETYLMVSDVLVPMRSAEVEAEGSMMPGLVVSLFTGSLASIAFSGASSVVSERGPESIEGASRRTAAQIAQLILADYVQRGWM